MSNLSLIEAFRRDVLDDARFVQAIDEASNLSWIEGEGCLAWTMRDGTFPIGDGLWPVDIDWVDLRQAWFGNVPVILPNGELYRSVAENQASTLDRVSAEKVIRRADELAREVVSVWERFLEPLRSGVVQATGLTLAGMMTPIPGAIWQSPATLIDVHLGEINRHDPGAEDDAIERMWMAVSLIVQDDVAAGLKSRKGGRPLEYDWERAMLYLIAWIERKGVPDGKPAATSLVTQIIEKLEQKTPERRQVEREIERRLPALNRFLLDRGKTDFAAYFLTLEPKKL